LAKARATPSGSPPQADAREQVHPRYRERERGDVARGARAQGGEDDDGEELDGGHRPQGQAVDRGVEAEVHRGEDASPGEQGAAAVGVEAAPRAPGPAPGREDHRGGGDAQPGDAGSVDPGEEQDGEGGAQVMEDGGADEVQVRRHRPRTLAEARRRRQGRSQVSSP